MFKLESTILKTTLLAFTSTLIISCGGSDGGPDPSPTPDPTTSPEPTVEPSPSPTPDASPSPSPTPDVSPSPTPDVSPSPTPDVSPSPTPTPDPQGWVLVWEDNFDGPEIDTSKWDFEVNCWGGGNNEQQCYTDREENAFIQDGVLNIVARREDYTGSSLNEEDPNYPGADKTLPYTSARLRTRGLAEWSYGRFEMRAQLPFGQGTWPAFWMLPANSPYGGWASSGEIDIMEAINLKTDKGNGELETSVFGTLHYGRGWPDNRYSGAEYELPDGANPADDFHTYALEWEDGEIRWYVDGVHYATQREDGWYSQYNNGEELVDAPVGAPFDDAAPFHLLINLAVGGSLPSGENEGGIDESVFPQSYLIDYVRVYECTASPSTGAGCANIGDNAELVEGHNRPLLGDADPAPSPEANVFIDAITDWAIDSYSAEGSSTTNNIITDPVDPTGHDQVVEFSFTGDESVTWFATEQPLNFSSYAGGTLEFDLYVVEEPEGTTWMMKTENFPATTGDVPLTDSVEGTAPVVGQWQHFTFNIDDLVNREGSDISLDVLLTPLVIFPAWGNQDGAVFRVDNVVLKEAVQ